MSVHQPALDQRRQLVFAACQLAASFMLFFMLFGCGPIDTSSNYIPAPEVAEAAVKTSMEAWLKGEQSEIIVGTKPAIQFIDPQHNSGLSLIRYEILGEVAANASRCYAVRVRVKSPQDGSEKDLRLKYVVMGIDPVCVWEQQDYLMVTHWDHHMKEPASRETPKK